MSIKGDCMKHNSDIGIDFSELKELKEDSIQAKLWKLLDDIDTASDMFKPEQTPFYKYIMKKAEERFKHITSDGYKLYKL